MSFPNFSNQTDDAENKRREAEAEAIRQKSLMVILSPEARQRLMNVKMVKPELAAAVENYLLNAAAARRINRPLSDQELKQILLSIQQPKKDFRINRL